MKAFLEEYGMIVVAVIVGAGLLALAIWASQKVKISSGHLVDAFTNEANVLEPEATNPPAPGH